jgi:hypothetical protein
MSLAISQFSKEKIIKILLVDDDRADYTLFKYFLKHISVLRIELDYTSSYDEALKQLLSNDYDLCFVDYSLGKDSGMDLIAELNEKGVRGPFIILTNVERPELYEFSSHMNVYSYLLKNELSSSLLQREIVYTLQRRKVESDLRCEKEFSDNAIELIPDLVITLNREHEIINANIESLHSLDIKLEDIVGKSLYDFYRFTDITISRFSQNRDIYEMVAVNPSARHIIEWKTYTIVRDFQDCLVLIGRDVTQKKLDDRYKAQIDKMAALGQLSGGVAHEINNLLQPILLNSEIALKETDNENVLEALTEIKENTMLASSIVQDILLFSRKSSDRLEATSFALVFDKVMEIILSAQPNDIEITVNNLISRLDLKTFASISTLHRVLNNLVKNAAHAMRNKGRVDIDLDFIKEESEKGAIFIKVSDTGEGIDEDNIGLLFNPFFTTKGPNEGTGLGLSIVYNLVEEWGGRVSVESVRGAGSVFSISIPVT